MKSQSYLRKRIEENFSDFGSSFFRMKNEKQDLSSLSWLFSEKNEEKAFHFSF
jgi:hypothetical protein